MKAIFEIDTETLEGPAKKIEEKLKMGSDDFLINRIFIFPSITSVEHYEKRPIMALIGELSSMGLDCLIKVEE